MAWEWVQKIKDKVTGQIITCFIPPDTPEQCGLDAGSYIVTANPYESESDYNRDKVYVELMLNQAPSIYPDFRHLEDFDTRYDSWNLYGSGGGLNVVLDRILSQYNTNRYDCYGYFYNMGTRLFGTNFYTSFPEGTWDGDTWYSSYCGLVCAYNEDLQRMHIGFVNLYREKVSSYPKDTYYYCIYKNFAANGNLWSIFHDSIQPSGGGSGPYHTDDYDEPIQGDASYDDSSDTVENPALPVVTANTSGFVTAFVPSIGELNALANYLISPTFGQAIAGSSLLSGFKEMLLGLQIFPCSVPAETPERVYCYLPGTKLNTGCDMGRASNQFVEIDCGDLEVEEYWGNCCDYNPYTTIGIFLPFCGFYDLDTDDVMGKTLNVSYRVDIMSGACLATIKVDGSVMYQYSGTCSAQIPLNSTSFDEFFKSMIEMGCATATGGAGLVAAGSAMDVGMARAADVSKKNMKLAGKMGLAANDAYESAKINSQTSVIGATANAVIGSKGRYKHAGALGSSIGFLGVRKPYLIIKRPHQQIPDMYGKFHGYPAFTKANLNDLTGYTVVDDIRLNIPDATVEEIIECEKLLKEGVVL